jgi:hypothetical protein
VIVQGHHTASHKLGNLTRCRPGNPEQPRPNPLPPRTGRSARTHTWDNSRSQPRRFGVIWVIEDHRALRAI